MSDRVFLSLMAALGVGMIAVATVWPQGLGARSPGPFGHTPIQQTPAMRAMLQREAARVAARHQAQVQAAANQLRKLNQPTPAAPAATKSAAPPSAAAPSALRPQQ